MDKNTGNFYTTEQKMDREALCPKETKAEECIILHNAVVGPSGDLIQFPVIIEDINDNAPHFGNSEIHLRMSLWGPVSFWMTRLRTGMPDLMARCITT